MEIIRISRENEIKLKETMDKLSESLELLNDLKARQLQLSNINRVNLQKFLKNIVFKG